jgi:hypothetical protein
MHVEQSSLTDLRTLAESAATPADAYKEQEGVSRSEFSLTNFPWYM